MRQEQWVARTAATQEAYQTCLSEGQQLIALLRQQAHKENFDNVESISVVEQVNFLTISCASIFKMQMLSDIEHHHQHIGEQWPQQRAALQLATKYRTFEQDCSTVRQQLDGWREDMRQVISCRSCIRKRHFR